MSAVADMPVQPSMRRMRQFEVRPDRDLGQNFLVDSNILGVIGRAAELERSDVVLEIGGGLGVLSEYLAERAEVEAHRIAPVDAHVGVRAGRVEQRVAQALVDLDDMHVASPLGEVLREHAQAAPDLEDHIGGSELGGATDHAEDVRVDEEVLAELPVGPHRELAHPADARLDGRVGHGAHHHPNSRAALRSTVAPSSSAPTPRSSAMNAAVCVT